MKYGRTTVGAVRIVWSAGRVQVILLLLLTTLTALIYPLSVALSERVVNLAVGAAQGSTRAGQWVPWAAALGLCFAALRLLPTMDHNYQRRLAEAVSLHVDKLYLTAVSGADQVIFETSEWRDRMTRASRSLGGRTTMLSQGLLQFYSSVITSIGLLVILLTLSPFLVLLAVVFMVIALPQQHAQANQLYRLHDALTTNERERLYLRFLLGEAMPSKELRAYGLSRHLLDRYLDAGAHWLREFTAVIRRMNRLAFLVGVGTAAVAVASYIYVIELGVHGSISPGGVAASIGAFVGLTGQLSQLGGGITEIRESTVFLDDFFSFLAVKPAVTAAEPTARIPQAGQSIVFENVSFSYPRAATPAISELNLTIGHGELVAIVGPNGSGKTSLIKLLLRFYDPDIGSVRIGGVDLRHANPEDIREHIGVLFQDYMSYDFTVRDNVTFGRVGKQYSDLDLETALRNAQAWELVNGLINGVDSHLGTIWEDGHNLSGGELQRLALARLFFRDADIWILDEPAASLDAEAEAAVFAQVKRQLSGRTGIITSHRFSTVRLADRIAVMTDGTVTELGTHDELIRLGGKYAELFELQAQHYR